ncbi:MAG: tRNA (5-methylaminomethyl-2-thiouridine)(34)-methyltransferase MnmD [Bacteroidota bacterium]
MQEIVISEDGSHTLYQPDLDEHYHSIHGAITESMHIYINAGLKQSPKQDISIFEAGFGTGLNALLTWQYAVAGKRNIYYHSLEKFPVAAEIYNQLNYCHRLKIPCDIFLKMHTCHWNKAFNTGHGFVLEKTMADLVSFEFTKSYDIFYFDAFSPSRQPELWTDSIFQKIFRAANPGAVLTTFSVKGEVRRSMEHAGFRVELLPGPPGKNAIIRAVKD